MTELRGSATLTVSSEFNGSFLKANAVDGNTSTDWASASEGSASWIQFTWGSSVTIREIRLLSRTTDNWGTPRFTFSDASYVDGWTPVTTAIADVTYPLLFPKTTTSLMVSVATDQVSAGTNVNPGFREVYINDAYSGSPPSTDLTHPSTLTAISSFSASFSKWLLIDGTTGNEWASLGAGSAAWIQFNYSSAVQIDSVQLRDRAGAERWGTPRFTFDDASTQDGGGAVSNTGLTTYTLTPKISTTLRISVASGSAGSSIGLAEAIITGLVNPSAGGPRLNGTSIQIIG